MDLVKLRRSLSASAAKRRKVAFDGAGGTPSTPADADDAEWCIGDVAVLKNGGSSQYHGLVHLVSLTGGTLSHLPPTLHVEFNYRLELSTVRGREALVLRYASDDKVRPRLVYADEVRKVKVDFVLTKSPVHMNSQWRAGSSISRASSTPPTPLKPALKSKLRWPVQPAAAQTKSPAVEPPQPPQPKAAAAPAKRKRKRRSGPLAKLDTTGSRWLRQMRETGHRMRDRRVATFGNYACHDKYAFKSVTIEQMQGTDVKIAK